MEIATMTDAAMVPGSESYYLWHIYIVLLLILALIGVCVFQKMLRSTYCKLSKRRDLNDEN